MKHGILGAGGVGGLVGAVLADAGDEVTLIVRPGTEGSYPRELALESTFRSLTVPVSIAGSLDHPVDVLWIATKATQLEEALKGVGDKHGIGTVVPLLNGVDHVARLRQRFGDDRVVAATIAVESERLAPGRIAHRSPFIRFGTTTSAEERLRPSIEKFKSFGFEIRIAPDEATVLWTKLVFLAPIALTTAAWKCTIGEIVAAPDRLAALRACVAEACAVAAAEGAKVDGAAVLKGIETLPGHMRSSMQKDVTSGRPPELDAIAGPILRGGKRHGIDVPATADLAQRLVAVGGALRT